MSCSKIYYNSLVTWHFQSTMQIGLKSRNSLSGAEHKMRNGGMLAGKKVGGTCWTAGPTMEFNTLSHGMVLYTSSGSKKGHSPLSSGSKFTRKMLLNLSTSPAFRGWCSETQSSGTIRTKPRLRRCAWVLPLTLLFVFSFCLSSKCWRGLGHHSCHSHFLHHQHPLSGCTELPCTSSDTQ